METRHSSTPVVYLTPWWRPLAAKRGVIFMNISILNQGKITLLSENYRENDKTWPLCGGIPPYYFLGAVPQVGYLNHPSWHPWWPKMHDCQEYFQSEQGVKLHCSAKNVERAMKLGYFVEGYHSVTVKGLYPRSGCLCHPRWRPWWH